jgi:hypothetical protein
MQKNVPAGNFGGDIPPLHPINFGFALFFIVAGTVSDGHFFSPSDEVRLYPRRKVPVKICDRGIFY